MSTQIYCDGDNRNIITEKSIAFIEGVFNSHPELESVFVPTTKDIEVMISKEDGKLTGYWSSHNGEEDYGELKNFLEVHQLKQNQVVEEIVESGY